MKTLPEKQQEMKQRQELETAENEVEAMQARVVPSMEPVTPAEAKRVARDNFYKVYMRIPEDCELQGVLEKYRSSHLSVYGLLHALAAEYMMRGLNPPGIAYLNLITQRLLGKIPLPILRNGEEEDEEDPMSVAEIRRLLED